MMDFLRGLSPRHATSGRAHAALPSRFESDGPLRAVPAPQGPPQPTEKPAIAAEIVPPDAQAEVTMRATEEGRRGGAATRVGDASSGSRSDRPATTRGSEAPGPPAVSVSRFPAITHPDAGDTTVRQTTSSAQGSAAADTSSVHPALPGRAYAAMPLGSTWLASPTPEAPLTPHTVAGHIAQRAEHRPIVHVTIDRIEVRAPQASSGQKPPHRTRSARATTSSLADYLRARQSERRGGSS